MAYKTLDSVGPLANAPNPTMEHALVMQPGTEIGQMSRGGSMPEVTFTRETNMIKNAINYLNKERY